MVWVDGLAVMVEKLVDNPLRVVVLRLSEVAPEVTVRN